MTAADAKRDQDELLLAAYGRFRWLSDDGEKLLRDPSFDPRRDWRLRVEVEDAQNGYVTAKLPILLERALSPRDSMRFQRAQKALHTA